MATSDVEICMNTLVYDPHTGALTWKRSGRAAGCVRPDKYVVVRVNGKLEYAHRLAFKLQGLPSPTVVDHINGNPSDNRWCNLRPANQSGNIANSRKTKTKTYSKYKGVTRIRGRKKCWMAQIGFSGNSIKLGYFFTEEDAARRYNQEAIELFGKMAYLNEVTDGNV